MKVSARNVFRGNITSLVHGAVNAEVEVTTSGGDKIVAIVTEGSVKSLGLAIGKEAIAYFKAPWVMLITGDGDIRFSARNQLTGNVKHFIKGAVNTEVTLALSGGGLVHAVITNESADELGIKEGVPATALIKANSVILGVPV
jgi:molybdate transport system regulatory protein